jgi:hypothetical protein
MSKEFFLDERRDEIALMRRNDGDAVAQHAQSDDEVFGRWRAAMRFARNQARRTKRCRETQSGDLDSDNGSRFGLLLTQAEHAKQ